MFLPTGDNRRIIYYHWNFYQASILACCNRSKVSCFPLVPIHSQAYTAEKIYEHVKALPESTAREILDLVEFVEAKRKLIEASQSVSRIERLEKMRVARGLWAQRDDFPDLPKLRDEWDRGFNQGEL